MKKVVLVLLATGAAMVSCKNEPARNTKPQDVAPDESTNKEIALNSDSPIADNSAAYLYVTARNGLSLRAFENLQSKRLAKMPYGTRIRVIAPEDRPTMTVGGISGGMHQVEFNHKTGYAFSGYLSRYFPPEPDITVEGYANELRQHFPDVRYEKLAGDSVSEPETNEMISLPNATWHEAFFVAQQLFDFPKEFDFPNESGPLTQIFQDSKPKDGYWTSQLEVTRDENGLASIAYRYEGQKFKSLVEILPSDGTMVLKRTETIK